jgi:hypothetical protein
MTLKRNISQVNYLVTRPHHFELKGDFSMKSINKETQPGSSVGWLDGVQMSKQDRRIAKAYLRKTEAIFDLVWLAGARIRGIFARVPADRASVGSGLPGQAPSAGHRA